MGCGSSVANSQTIPSSYKTVDHLQSKVNLLKKISPREITTSPSKVSRQKSTQPPVITITSPSEDQIAQVKKLVATASRANVKDIVSEKDIKSILSLSNEYKDSDAYLGLQAPSFDIRMQSRKALEVLRIGSLVASELMEDSVSLKTDEIFNQQKFTQIEEKTFLNIKKQILESDAITLRSLSEAFPADVIATVAKLLSSEELTKVCKTLSSSKFGTVLQVDSPTADEITLQLLEGLSYGCGDVLIVVTTQSTNKEDVKELLKRVRDLLSCFNLDVPVVIQSPCYDEPSHRVNTIGGCTKLNKRLGFDEDRQDVLSPYFETGQGSVASSKDVSDLDALLLEARAQAFIKSLQQRQNHPFYVCAVEGFSKLERYKLQQLIRNSLEDIFIGRMLGLNIGIDICSSYHSNIDLKMLDTALNHIIAASPDFIVVTPGRHNVSLGCITTGPREINRLRSENSIPFSEKMKSFLATQDFVDANGTTNEKFGDVSSLYSKFHKTQEGLPALKDALAALHARKVDIGNSFSGVFETPEEVQNALIESYERCTKAIGADFTEPFMNRYSDSPFLTTDVLDRTEFFQFPLLSDTLSDKGLQDFQKQITSWEEIVSTTSAEVGNSSIDLEFQFVLADGLQAEGLQGDSVASFLEAVQRGFAVRGMKINPHGHLLVVKHGRLRSCVSVSKIVFSANADKKRLSLMIALLGEVPGCNSTYRVCLCAQPNHLWEWKDIETLTGSTQSYLAVGVDGEMKPQDAADKLCLQIDDCMKKFVSEAVIQDTLYRKPCLDIKGFAYLL